MDRKTHWLSCQEFYNVGGNCDYCFFEKQARTCIPWNAGEGEVISRNPDHKFVVVWVPTEDEVAEILRATYPLVDRE